MTACGKNVAKSREIMAVRVIKIAAAEFLEKLQHYIVITVGRTKLGL